MMFKQTLTLLMFCFVFSSHATDSSDTSEGRVVTFGKCPVSQASYTEIAPIAATLLQVLAPVVVNKIVDLAANAATEAGKTSTTTLATASYQGHFYRSTDKGSTALNASLGCIVFLRGSIQDVEVTPPSGWQQSGIGTVARIVGLSGNPGFYLETTIQVSSDRNFFRLVPQYLYYGKAMKDSSWRPTARGVAANISMISSGEAEPFASATLMFPALQPGTELSGKYLTGLGSNWMVMPALSEGAKKQLEPLIQRTQKIKDYEAQIATVAPKSPKSALEVQLEDAQGKLCIRLAAEKITDTNCPRDIIIARQNIAEIQHDIVSEKNRLLATKALADVKSQAMEVPKEILPFNINVSMTETASGSEFLKFVGSVLTEAKPGIEELVKSKLPEAKASAQTANDAALVAALTAKTEVEKKIIDIGAETSETEKSKLALDLIKLKLSANIAYRKAGLPEPYPGLEI